MNKKMHDLIDANFDELVAAVQKFIRIDSVADDDKVDMAAMYPFGEKMANILTEFLAYAAQQGFIVKNVANAAGHAECGGDSSAAQSIIGVLCHLDVVPIGSRDQWKHEPFGGEIDGGRLYGRGSVDDKGPAVVSLYALKALRDCGVPLNHRYRLIVGLDEESGFSRCLGKYLENEETPMYSFSPDASFPVINAEKGILRFDINGSCTWGKPSEQARRNINLVKIAAGDRYNVVPDSATAYFEGDINQIKEILSPLADQDCSMKEEGGKLAFTVRGVSAHAMEPHKGKNALQGLMEKLARLKLATAGEDGLPNELLNICTLVGNTPQGGTVTGVQFGIACKDEVSGSLTCNAAALKFENDKYSLRFDVRYPVTANSEKIIEDIKRAVQIQGVTVTIQQNKLPLHLPAEMPFIQVLLGAYNDLTGDKGEPLCIGGGTYCRFLKNAVSFGPIFPNEEVTEHKPDEYVSLESLRKTTHIYAEALYRINAGAIG
ncbi:MAG: Sapep family Mn(2+)-dependent dipeptidase [Deferribacteraceae bacterium]|nr:Sapep family Mn(2+)-dependent dipeptidase [Deferribacteraceae bacterium]